MNLYHNLPIVMVEPNGCFVQTCPCARGILMVYTRKNAQLVTNLQQTCSKLAPTNLLQDLFALLVPNLLTSCYKHAPGLLQPC